MKTILKHKLEILTAIVFGLLYFFTRLIFLGDFPIFTDEAIYTRWAQIALNDANWRFISLTDGKQPSFIWAGMIMMKILGDPLLSMRLVSVIAGFISMIGIGILTYELFKNKFAAFLSSFIYLVIPFAVVYDRLALYDSLLGAFTIWAIYFSILLVRNIRLDIALILGFIFGGALLTKSSAILGIYLLPFTLILFDFKNKKWKNNLIKWGIFVVIAIILSQGILSVIKLSPFAHIISEKNSIFVLGYFELLKDPFVFLIGNLKGLISWLVTYLFPLIFLVIIALINIKKFPREKLLIVVYFALPFVALAFYGKVIFPRFIFFMMLSLIPIFSIGIIEIIDWLNKYFSEREIKNKNVIAGLVIILFILYPIKTSVEFITNPENARIASADVEQYVKGWPSGGGVEASIEFFENEAKDNKIFIATEGTFGLMPASLEIYLGSNPNIETRGYWPINEFPDELDQISKSKDVYVIFYQPCPGCEFPGDAPDSWPLRLVDRVEKSENTFYSIYKVEQN